jgi:hypothetical protein
MAKQVIKSPKIDSTTTIREIDNGFLLVTEKYSKKSGYLGSSTVYSSTNPLKTAIANNPKPKQVPNKSSNKGGVKK